MRILTIWMEIRIFLERNIKVALAEGKREVSSITLARTFSECLAEQPGGQIDISLKEATSKRTK